MFSKVKSISPTKQGICKREVLREKMGHLQYCHNGASGLVGLDFCCFILSLGFPFLEGYHT